MFTSRLFLPPTHPQRPDDSPSQFPSSEGRLDTGPSAACQCQHVSQPASLPAQRGRLCSAAAIPAPGQGLFTSLFFSSFPLKEHILKAGSPSFPFCHLLRVESSLIGVGNSNNKKQARNFNAIYLSHRFRQQTGFQEYAKDLDSS